MQQLGDREEVKELDGVSWFGTTGYPSWELPKGSLVRLCISCSSKGWRMMVEARKKCGHQLS